MKKILLFISAVVIVSCWSQTNDDKIKETFHEYAKLNFDDPSKVKEVVGIDYGDTLTNQSLADIMSDLSMKADSLDSICGKIADKARSLAVKFGHKVRHNGAFLEDWNEYETSSQNRFEKMLEVLSTFVSDDFTPIFTPITQDSILRRPDFALLEFTLKYRIAENDGLRLKEIKGNVDLKTSKVYIGESGNSELLSFFKGIDKTMNPYMIRIETSSDVIQKASKIISYFE